MTFIHPLNTSLSIKDIAPHLYALCRCQECQKTTLLPLPTKSYIFIDLTDTEKNLINHKGLRQCNESDGLSFLAFSFIKMKNKSISLCEFICKMRRAHGGLVGWWSPGGQRSSLQMQRLHVQLHKLVEGASQSFFHHLTLKIGT